MKGTTGIDLDSPEKIHSIPALGNERLSGLELICLMHAAFQRVQAGTDVGVDFSHIWPAAQMMHVNLDLARSPDTGRRHPQASVRPTPHVWD